MTHQAHQPGHYVAGQPIEITLINDNGHEYPDWLWHDLDVVSDETLHEHVMRLLDTDDYDQVGAAFKFQICIEVYDSWWGRCAGDRLPDSEGGK
jgi:hypothetical protein